MIEDFRGDVPGDTVSKVEIRHAFAVSKSVFGVTGEAILGCALAGGASFPTSFALNGRILTSLSDGGEAILALYANGRTEAI